MRQSVTKSEPMLPFIIPEPDYFDISRADLSLGLRSASRYYFELIVPGIGGAYRTRHLSWAVAGIHMKELRETASTAVKIANGIEALANKLQWQAYESKTDSRNRGKLAFSRSAEEWSFDKLSHRKYYVQVTHRQQNTRALPIDTGLGLSTGSSRYNGMVLTPVGIDLARALLIRKGVGKGSPLLRTNLETWLISKFPMGDYAKELVSLLGPVTPNAEERAIVRSCLKSRISPLSDVCGTDPMRRIRLCEYFESLSGEKIESWNDVPDLLTWLAGQPGGLEHANDIRTAIVFEDLRNAAIGVFARIAELIPKTGSSILITAASSNEAVTQALKLFRREGANYESTAKTGGKVRQDVLSLCRIALSDDEQAIRSLIKLDGRIIAMTNERIIQGPVFRSDIQSAQNDEDEIDLSFRPNRIFQFLNLWRDCRG